ncbi:MAG: DUF2190 family protein [Planctomycetota bacterium]
MSASDHAYKGKGEVLDVTNNTSIDYSAGQMVELGDIVGIVSYDDIAAGEEGVVVIEGEHTYTAETGVAWSIGDQLYYNETSDHLTKTAGSNNKAGVAAAAKESSASTGRIKLNVNG